MLYRIFTENKKPRQVEQLVSQVFDGFTLVKTCGFWKGKPERGLLIEIDAVGDEKRDAVFKLAEALGALNDQESVMVQTIKDVHTIFI